jgi:hypothetical protein
MLPLTAGRYCLLLLVIACYYLLLLAILIPPLGFTAFFQSMMLKKRCWHAQCGAPIRFPLSHNNSPVAMHRVEQDGKWGSV